MAPGRGWLGSPLTPSAQNGAGKCEGLLGVVPLVPRVFSQNAGEPPLCRTGLKNQEFLLQGEGRAFSVHVAQNKLHFARAQCELHLGQGTPCSPCSLGLASISKSPGPG